MITTKLTSLISPRKATEEKAQQLQDASARDEQEKMRKTAGSHVVHGVKDPTTSEELDIRNADEGPDGRSQVSNVLDLEYLSPGEHLLIFHPEYMHISGFLVAHPVHDRLETTS